ncbi:histidine acid phosphatase family protein [Pelomyxa schiedti]|nr:histidine acid phosphatase family protein [Pelomyxa schiedti]
MREHVSSIVGAVARHIKGIGGRQPADLELLFVQVIARHGTRAPLGIFSSAFPKDTPCVGRPNPISTMSTSADTLVSHYVPEDQDPDETSTEPGRLTIFGVEEMINVGKYLRDSYVTQHHLLPEDYDPAFIFMRSTTVDRTIQSAKAIMRGLYPSEHRSSQHKAIPIYSLNQNAENMWPRSACRRLMEMKQKLKKTHGYQSILNKFSGIRDFLKDQFGEGIQKESFEGIHNSIEIMKRLNLPIQCKGISEKELQKMAHEASSTLMKELHSMEFLQLGIGRFLHDILESMRLKVAGKVTTKMCIYTGHDNTLAPIQRALGIFVGHPAMGSFLCLELYRTKKSSHDHYIRVLSDNRPVMLPFSKKQVYCPYATFLEHVGKYEIDTHSYEVQSALSW